VLANDEQLSRQIQHDAVLAVLYVALAAAFLFGLWGRRFARFDPPTPPDFTNTATVRLSAPIWYARRRHLGPGVLYLPRCRRTHYQVRRQGSVILSEPHKDIVLQHGRTTATITASSVTIPKIWKTSACMRQAFS